MAHNWESGPIDSSYGSFDRARRVTYVPKISNVSSQNWPSIIQNTKKNFDFQAKIFFDILALFTFSAISRLKVVRSSPRKVLHKANTVLRAPKQFHNAHLKMRLTRHTQS